MYLCRTSVPKEGGGFRDCGKPSEVSMFVGLQRCSYCKEHAEAARRYVERQGSGKIAATQLAVPNGLKSE